MKEVFASRTGIIGVIGVIAFVIFALPITHPWIAWPCLGIAMMALGRLIVVGDRHHQTVSDHLAMDDDEIADTRAQRIQDLLSEDRRP